MSRAGWEGMTMADLNIKDQPMHACNCVGPRPGEPVCPCRMRGLTKQDGRWVEIIDHGPVSVMSTMENSNERS